MMLVRHMKAFLAPHTYSRCDDAEWGISSCSHLQSHNRLSGGIFTEQRNAAGTRDAIQEQLRMGQELRRKVEAPGSGSEDDSDSDSATDASGDEGDEAAADLSKPSKKAIAKAKAAAMDIMQSELPVLVD